MAVLEVAAKELGVAVTTIFGRIKLPVDARQRGAWEIGDRLFENANGPQ
jgi:hypothetical protein